MCLRTIYADDLALARLLALFRARPSRAMNVCDDRQLRVPGDYFEQAADMYGLPRPPRISRSQAQEQLSPRELELYERIAPPLESPFKDRTRMRLRWPDASQGLAAGLGLAADQGRAAHCPAVVAPKHIALPAHFGLGRWGFAMRWPRAVVGGKPPPIRGTPDKAPPQVQQDRRAAE